MALRRQYSVRNEFPNIGSRDGCRGQFEGREHVIRVSQVIYDDLSISIYTASKRAAVISTQVFQRGWLSEDAAKAPYLSLSWTNTFHLVLLEVFGAHTLRKHDIQFLVCPTLCLWDLKATGTGVSMSQTSPGEWQASENPRGDHMFKSPSCPPSYVP